MGLKAGKQAEYQLIDKLRKHDYIVIHAPASGGGTKHPMPDIIFSKPKMPIYFVELKTCRKGKTIYISKEQVDNLKILEESFEDVIVIIVVKFIKLARGKYFMVNLHKLRKTNNNNYAVDFKSIKDNITLF